MTARFLVVVALMIAGCKSREPAPAPGERPTIESLGPPRVCFPRTQPDHRGQPSAATAPTSQPTTVPTSQPTTVPTSQPTTGPTTQAAAHGAAGHWCLICAAAAQRQAEAGRAKVATSSDRDLLQDLPPR